VLVFGFGLLTDVNNLSFAVLDRDKTPASRAYLEELRGLTYFSEEAVIADHRDIEKRLQNGDIKAGVEIPPGFRRDIQHRRPAWVSATVDGAIPPMQKPL
jgi:ribosome-dependent ATPase